DPAGSAIDVDGVEAGEIQTACLVDPDTLASVQKAIVGGTLSRGDRVLRVRAEIGGTGMAVPDAERQRYCSQDAEKKTDVFAIKTISCRDEMQIHADLDIQWSYRSRL
ncbi:MAG: hypothetical protein KDF64_10395, partial [Geminicoccaceae bacterium]|nr:hypothetical protein [Geminicoccaceae bacterium]